MNLSDTMMYNHLIITSKKIISDGGKVEFQRIDKSVYKKNILAIQNVTSGLQDRYSFRKKSNINKILRMIDKNGIENLKLKLI